MKMKKIKGITKTAKIISYVPSNLAISSLGVLLFVASCGQNSHMTFNPGNALSALSVSMSAFSNFIYTFDQNNSLPDLSWQITDNNTSAPYAGALNYSYAVGTVAVGSVPGASADESSIRPWSSTGSSAPSLGSGVQGLSPGVYYMNLQAINPATGAVLTTESVRFEVLASGSPQATVVLSGPAGGSSTAAGASETVTGTCSPNGSTVSVSGASLAASATGTCSAGVFSIPVVMSSSLAPGAQPQPPWC